MGYLRLGLAVSAALFLGAGTPLVSATVPPVLTAASASSLAGPLHHGIAVRTPRSLGTPRAASPRHVWVGRPGGLLPGSRRVGRPLGFAGSASPGLTRQGRRLRVDGTARPITGVNAYQLATLWSVNAGCGGQVDDLDAFFAALPPRALVRFWAFRSMAVDRTTHQVTFSALDRVFAAAARHGILLLPVLSDQAGTCDDAHWHDAAWYRSGYRSVFNDDGRGLTTMSLWDWLHLVVPRYAASPALGGWELVNEPESTNCDAPYSGGTCYGHGACPAGAADTLRQFFDSAGGELKRLDPRHLLFLGVIGGSQCGVAGTGYASLLASPAVDVATYHDYGNDNTALPAELSTRLRQAADADKPLLTEEVGIHSGPGCATEAARSQLLEAKLRRQLAAGDSGSLVWDMVVTRADGCNDDLAPTDDYLKWLIAQN